MKRKDKFQNRWLKKEAEKERKRKEKIAQFLAEQRHIDRLKILMFPELDNDNT